MLGVLVVLGCLSSFACECDRADEVCSVSPMLIQFDEDVFVLPTLSADSPPLAPWPCMLIIGIQSITKSNTGGGAWLVTLDIWWFHNHFEYHPNLLQVDCHTVDADGAHNMREIPSWPRDLRPGDNVQSWGTWGEPMETHGWAKIWCSCGNSDIITWDQPIS